MGKKRIQLCYQLDTVYLKTQIDLAGKDRKGYHMQIVISRNRGGCTNIRKNNL